MSTEPFIAELALFAFSFPPKGWALCNGQLLPIAQNQALFALLGTTYGGNGVTTFALPNLQERLPLGFEGNDLGEAGGSATHTLIQNEMPPHVHALTGSSASGALASPANNLPAVEAGEVAPLYGPPDGALLNAAAVQPAGGSQPHDNQPPSLVLNYCIALQGIFPSRD